VKGSHMSHSVLQRKFDGDEGTGRLGDGAPSLGGGDVDRQALDVMGKAVPHDRRRRRRRKGGERRRRRKKATLLRAKGSHMSQQCLTEEDDGDDGTG